MNEEDGRKCPFRGGTVTLPRGTNLQVAINLAHTDKKVFGDRPFKFDIEAHSKDKYLIWNGPYDAPAPRKCPGERLSFIIIKLMLDAYIADHDGAANDLEAVITTQPS